VIQFGRDLGNSSIPTFLLRADTAVMSDQLSRGFVHLGLEYVQTNV